MRAWLRFLYTCVCQKKAQAQIFVTKTGFYVLGIGDTASHLLAIINIACSNAVRPGIFLQFGALIMMMAIISVFG